MTKKIITACVALSVLLLANDSFAQEGGKRKPPKPEEIVKRLDKDNDGKISKEEADGAPRGRMKEHFDDIDANKDGFIEAQELKDVRGKMRKNGKGSK